MNKLGIEWKTAEPCSSDSIEPSVVQPIIIKRPQNAFDCDDPPNHGTSSRLIAEQFEKKVPTYAAVTHAVFFLRRVNIAKK